MTSRTPPYFHFPAVPPLSTYTFEALTPANADHLHYLLQQAPPFTDARFRTLKAAQKYAAGIER